MLHDVMLETKVFMPRTVYCPAYQLAPFKRSEKVCKEGETDMCSAKWSNIDGALPQTKSPHLEAQNNRIPSLINGQYDKDTKGQWGFHR